MEWFDKRIDARLNRPIPKASRRGRRRLMASGVVLALVFGGLTVWLVWSAFHRPQPITAIALPVAHAPDSVPMASDAAAQPADASAAAQANSPVQDGLPTEAADAALAAQTQEAQRQLRTLVPETRGMLYREVLMFAQGPIDSTSVVFCGQFDSIDPAGAYIGYQHFISSVEKAQIETMMTPGEFRQAWTQRCTGKPAAQNWG